MVVVVMLAVIILGLAAMFTQVQRAFRAGMTQTDVLEGGRTATEMIARELEQVKPSYVSVNYGQPNFYAGLVGVFSQTLPASSAQRMNIVDEVFFLVHENQTWTGIGYFLVPDFTSATPPGSFPPVGTLYRFETNTAAARFAQNPAGLFNGYINAHNLAFNLARNGNPATNATKILDGVVSFKCRTYDTNGYWINPLNISSTLPAVLSGNISLSPLPLTAGEVGVSTFYSNAVPAFVDFELGILEPHAYDRYKSIPVYPAQTNYLAQQAGRVHLFRQRVGVRNVDPAAYQ
jgi:hypothetical protein